MTIDEIRDEAQDSEDETGQAAQTESSTELISAKGTATVDDSAEEIPHRRSTYI